MSCMWLVLDIKYFNKINIYIKKEGMGEVGNGFCFFFLPGYVVCVWNDFIRNYRVIFKNLILYFF